MSAAVSHQIASKAAMQIVKEGAAAGLSWSDIAISCETAVSIVVATAVEMAGKPDRIQFATELVEMITERAHKRVTALILRVPDQE
jgi:hypothetical protein